MKLLKCQNPCITCGYSNKGKRSNIIECMYCDLMLDLERSPCNWCPNMKLDKSIEGGTCDICKLRKMYDASITDPRLIMPIKMMKYDDIRYKRIEKMIPDNNSKFESPQERLRKTNKKLFKFSSKHGYGDDYINLIFDMIIDHKKSIKEIAELAGVATYTIWRRIPKETEEIIKIGVRVPVCIVCGNIIKREYNDNGRYEQYSQYFNRKYCSDKCFKADNK